MHAPRLRRDRSTRHRSAHIRSLVSTAFAAALLVSNCLLAQHDVYVANSGSGTVSVIDTASATVAATIPVGTNPVAVVVTTDGTRALVANRIPPSVSIVDTATRTVTATIVVPAGAYSIATTPNGARALVTHYSPPALTVLDLTSNTVVTTLTLPATSPNWIVMRPDGNRAYVTCDSGQLFVIDPNTATIVNTVLVGRSFGQAISPDGARIYVVHDIGNGFSVFDTATDTVTVFVSLGAPLTSLPIGAAVSPDGSRLFLTIPNNVHQSGTVTGIFADYRVLAIDTATNIVLNTSIVGLRPMRAVVRPDGARVYVTNSSSASVSVLDAASNTVVATIPVGTSPQGLAIAPEPFRPPGCVGSNAGVPRLDAQPANARAGTTETYNLSNSVASTSAIFLFGFSATSWSGIALPFPLASIGLQPTCFLHVEPASSLVASVSGTGTASVPLALPLGLPLGLTVFVQAAVVDGGVASAAPFVVSNGVSTTIVR